LKKQQAIIHQIYDEPENDDLDSVVVSKEPNYESEGDEAHISLSDPEPLNRLTTRKRKYSTTKKTRSNNRKRR
jgi:hypothetical protein